MRARAAVGSVLASAGILLLGWQAGAPLASGGADSTVSAPLVPGGATSTDSGAAGASTVGATQGATVRSTAGASASTAGGTFVGATVATRFGDVQVQVTVASGTIAEVMPLHLTDADGRSRQISNRAAPILHDEVLASQSARVSMVSGATYTSRAYLQSLQSALDQAGL